MSKWNLSTEKSLWIFFFLLMWGRGLWKGDMTDPCKALRSLSFLQEICDWMQAPERKHQVYRERKGKQRAKVVTLNRGYGSILRKTSCLARRLENKMKNTELQWLLRKYISQPSLPWAGLALKTPWFPKAGEFLMESLPASHLPCFGGHSKAFVILWLIPGCTTSLAEFWVPHPQPWECTFC